MDLGAGQSIPEITAARGLFRDIHTGEAGHFDVEQAYVSYIGDIGRGLRFDLGKFYAPVGYESVDRYDAYNDSYTHSFLFGYSAPFTTTGLKISYPFSDQVSGMVMVVQGWDNVADNNTGKTLGAQLAVTPTQAFTMVLNYMAGPEQNGTNSNWRYLYDFCATWKATPSLTLGLNADYGHEAECSGTGTKRVLGRRGPLRHLRLHRPLHPGPQGGELQRHGRGADGDGAEPPGGHPHSHL